MSGQSSPFMSLPAELKQIVFDQLLLSDEPLVAGGNITERVLLKQHWFYVADDGLRKFRYPIRDLNVLGVCSAFEAQASSTF